MIRYRLRFARKGFLRFLSHLEQIQFIRRLLRRTGIPVVYTQGFHPQPKISFGPAISVGYESEAEYVDIELKHEIEISELAKNIVQYLPENFSLIELKKIPDFVPSLQPYINLAEYYVKCVDLNQVSLRHLKHIDVFLSGEHILIKKTKNDKEEIIDAKPLILEFRRIENDSFVLFLRFAPKKNVKPEKIIQEFLGLSDQDIKKLLILRKQLYHETPQLQILSLM